MTSSNIKIISADVRGLRQNIKRRDLIDYFKNQQPVIICLQETHLVQEDVNMLIKEWNLEYFISGSSTNSRGVAILLNNTFKYSVSKVTRDKEGRFIIVDLDIANLFTLTIANVYAPNTDDSNWYQHCFEQLLKTREKRVWLIYGESPMIRLKASLGDHINLVEDLDWITSFYPMTYSTSTQKWNICQHIKVIIIQ